MEDWNKKRIILILRWTAIQVNSCLILREGLGLGLNTVYPIVTRDEGTVGLESEERAGATFTPTFPVRRGEP